MSISVEAIQVSTIYIYYFMKKLGKCIDIPMKNKIRHSDQKAVLTCDCRAKKRQKFKFQHVISLVTSSVLLSILPFHETFSVETIFNFQMVSQGCSEEK